MIRSCVGGVHCLSALSHIFENKIIYLLGTDVALYKLP